MKNVLVTGGAGFIGSHTAVALSEAGYNPVILDNFANSERSVVDRLKELVGKSLEFYEGDVGDAELITKVVQENNIEGIIHFAAYKAVGESVENPIKYYRNNISNLVSLLSVVEKCAVPSFVFSSSCTVYGEAESLPIDEDEPVKPAASPYGSTKQMGEIIIKDTVNASKHLKSLSLRYFNPIGAHPSAKIGELPIGVPANLVPFVTQTAAGLREQLIVYGNDYSTQDGTCIRDYIHVVDLAKAHVAALKHLNEKSAPYYDVCNVGTGSGTSVLEVIKTFEKVTGEKVTYNIGSRRPGDVTAAYASVGKAKTLLNWQAELTIEDALRDAWNWQQSLAKKS